MDQATKTGNSADRDESLNIKPICNLRKEFNKVNINI